MDITNNEETKSTTTPTAEISKQESGRFNIISSHIGVAGSVVFFILAAYYYLVVRNSDVLFMEQLRSLFVDTPEFFKQCMSQPGGFLIWASCWFTQFFYHPQIGASILIAIWIISFFLMKWVFRFSDWLSPLLFVPLICLLVSEIDLGYWIYYMKVPGYYFHSSLGILTSMLLLACRPNHGNKIIRFSASIAYMVCIAALYPLLGMYSVLTLACLLLMSLLERKWIDSAVAGTLTAFVPLLFIRLYATQTTSSAFTAGLPAFASGNIVDESLTTPITIAVFSLLAFSCMRKVKMVHTPVRHKGWAAVCVLLFMLGGGYVSLSDSEYDDQNFRAECKAYAATDDQRWDDVLSAVRSVDGLLTRELIMLKNIALFNTGDIGESMYDYDDKGKTPEMSDSLKIHLVNTAAPLIYLHHGMTNFAYRWCIENEVETGFNIAELKVLVMASLINGETKVAEKYLDILSHTLYYKEWAEEYMKLVHNPKLIATYPTLKNAAEIHSCIGNHTDSDAGLCESFIMHYFGGTQNKDSKYMQEMTLAYAMMEKDIQAFWPKYLLYLYLHQGEKVPTLYQQAAYMYGCLEPQSAPSPQQYGISFDQATIIDAYKQFQQAAQGYLSQGMSEAAVADATKAQYGNTFWWVYFFNRGSMYY